jgi:hypothetical protein
LLPFRSTDYRVRYANHSASSRSSELPYFEISADASYVPTNIGTHFDAIYAVVVERLAFRWKKESGCPLMPLIRERARHADGRCSESDQPPLFVIFADEHRSEADLGSLGRTSSARGGFLDTFTEAAAAKFGDDCLNQRELPRRISTQSRVARARANRRR